MSNESPLFQSAMELFGHSISHFNGQQELDRKLVILHLANSVELLMKDLILRSGESIYKNPKETITVHGCIQILNEKSINIPYLNKLELLIDERNALQHRFGYPNELTSIFYMGIAMDFFREVLTDLYELDFEETLAQFTPTSDLQTYQMREPSDEGELDNLRRLAGVHPLGALLSAMNYMEQSILKFGERIGLERELRLRISFMISYKTLERYGVAIPDDLGRELMELRTLRNMAAHGRKDPSRDEVIQAIETIENFEQYMNSLDTDKIRPVIEEKLQERERETRQIILPIAPVRDSEQPT